MQNAIPSNLSYKEKTMIKYILTPYGYKRLSFFNRVIHTYVHNRGFFYLWGARLTAMGLVIIGLSYIWR